MKTRSVRILIGIMVLLAVAVATVAVPNINFKVGGWHFDRSGLRLGLDLRGGTHVVLQADLSQVTDNDQGDAMDGVVSIIRNRVDAYGVTEPVIQVLGGDRISVQLPGVRDKEEAIRLIGQTAQLDFREHQVDPEGKVVTDEGGNPKWAPATADLDGQRIHLTGRYLKRNSQVVIDQQTNQPQVAFEFDRSGARLFEQITGRLVGKPLGIFLDDKLVSDPIVRAVISDRGVIEGIALNEARTLAIQLNAGALPVPVEVVQQEDVDATLASDSLQKSLMAGLIGLATVIFFMVAYYRVPGTMAAAALLVYGSIVLAVFKLWPVTLTLAGIAAFILSIGMAVDANILIFERMKEELRTGRTLAAAMEAGFDRAWPSIRDSNVSTFITCAILYWFGNTFGEASVKGFALTLAIGVAISMFSALTVSHTFLRVVARSPLGHRPNLFTPSPATKEQHAS
ncbi:MAG: protein translocase subunit SecD [Chloroflexi bacterium]|nr:protein translocase subunit SecD [Chloroflexota bacterium]